MKPKIIVISLLLALIGTLSYSTLSLAQEDAEVPDPEAAESEEITNPEVVQTDDSCPADLSQDILNRKLNFYQTLESQIESPELTSDRLYDLYEDFQRVRNDMQSMAKRVPGANNSERDIISSRVISCQTLVREQFSEMNQVFDQYLSQSAFLKRNYLLIEKYDHLNEKLGETQENLQSLYLDLNTFETQMLCYSASCLQN